MLYIYIIIILYVQLFSCFFCGLKHSLIFLEHSFEGTIAFDFRSREPQTIRGNSYSSVSLESATAQSMAAVPRLDRFGLQAPMPLHQEAELLTDGVL